MCHVTPRLATLRHALLRCRRVTCPPTQVAPGGRLPLPLRWSRAEDIRLRPLVRRNSKRETGGTVGDDSLLASSSSAERVEDAADSKQAGVLLVGEPEGGREGQAFESSDCSVLVPAARWVIPTRARAPVPKGQGIFREQSAS